MESERKKCELLERNTSRKTRNCGRTQRHRLKVREEERPYTVDSSEVLVSLCKWLRLKGMTRHLGLQLRPAVFPQTGRGLMATKKVSSGEVVVSIPIQVLITCDNVMNREQMGSIICQSGRKLKAMEMLTAFLVHHKFLKEASPWKPYLDSLPDSYTVPLYCSKCEFSLLPEFLMCFVDQQEHDVSTCYENVKDILKESLGTDICMDDIKWGWFTVNTRAVYLRNESPDPLLLDDDIYALVPFLDLLNHTPSAQVNTGLNKKNNCYEIITHTPYGQFEQVFINYGPHDNVKLYREYGFTIPNNPHDSVVVVLDEVKIAVQEMSGEFQGAMEMYRKCKLLKGHHMDEGLAITCEGPSYNLVVAATILLMTEEELQRWQLVYKDHEDVQHRHLVIKVLDWIIMYKLHYFSKCLTEMEAAVNCTEAFAAARALVKGCYDLLKKVTVKELK